ncbi:MAG: hypothetical protein OXE99_03695 [Cellvibrionales bacterium]|nr:hypothetical protein [Cellvibrionales bacterium]
MQAIAQWILSHRLAAAAWVLITLATSPWISLNALLGVFGLALVWLRKGDKEGLILTSWAMIPALCIAYQFTNLMPTLLVIITAIGSMTLRRTAGWHLALVSLSASTIIVSLLLMFTGDSYLSVYIHAYEQLATQLHQQAQTNPELMKQIPATLTLSTVAGFLGSTLITSSFFCLLLARYYQAKLFNPNGLQKEFHLLSLSKAETLCAIVVTGFFISQTNFHSWIWMAMFPLVISGIALFHFFAKQKHLAIGWYILFYIVLIVVNPFKFVMATFAAIDSFNSLRAQIAKTPTE